MSETDNAQDVIKSIYFDRSGSGSMKTTLKEAREKDKTITMAGVQQFFRKNVEQKKQLREKNSFIAPEPFYELGLIMIDVFSRLMHVVPIKGKDEAKGMIEAFHKMGGKLQILYTDDEGALQKEAIREYLDKEGIHHHRTRAHANFTERAIKTFKDMLYKRVEADEKKGKQNIQWSDYILEILLTYNSKMVHRFIVLLK